MVKAHVLKTRVEDLSQTGLIMAQLVEETPGYTNLVVKVSKDFGYSDLVAFFVGRKLTFLIKEEFRTIECLVADIEWEQSYFDESGEYMTVIRTVEKQPEI